MVSIFSEDSTVAKYYWFIVALVATLLLIFALTAYSKGLDQLGQFGFIYLSMLAFGFVTWLFKTYGFNLNEEPYPSRSIFGGVIIAFALFITTSIITGVTKRWSFLASLELGQGFLAPLASSTPDSSATALTFIMNIPAPVAEEAFFRVFLITAFTMGLSKGTMRLYSHTAKISIIAMSATIFGFFHWYAYGANIFQIFAAIAAGVILSFYYVYVQASAIVVTVGHFIYNFSVLLISFFGTAATATAMALNPITAPFVAVVPMLCFLLVYKTRKTTSKLK